MDFRWLGLGSEVTSIVSLEILLRLYMQHFKYILLMVSAATFVLRCIVHIAETDRHGLKAMLPKNCISMYLILLRWKLLN